MDAKEWTTFSNALANAVYSLLFMRNIPSLMGKSSILVVIFNSVSFTCLYTGMRGRMIVEFMLILTYTHILSITITITTSTI